MKRALQSEVMKKYWRDVKAGILPSPRRKKTEIQEGNKQPVQASPSPVSQVESVTEKPAAQERPKVSPLAKTDTIQWPMPGVHSQLIDKAEEEIREQQRQHTPQPQIQPIPQPKTGPKPTPIASPPSKPLVSFAPKPGETQVNVAVGRKVPVVFNQPIKVIMQIGRRRLPQG